MSDKTRYVATRRRLTTQGAHHSRRQLPSDNFTAAFETRCRPLFRDTYRFTHDLQLDLPAWRRSWAAERSVWPICVASIRPAAPVDREPVSMKPFYIPLVTIARSARTTELTFLRAASSSMFTSAAGAARNRLNTTNVKDDHRQNTDQAGMSVLD